jgi:hypothetical protein
MMNLKQEELKNSLDIFYSKEDLFKLFKHYFLNFIADGYIGSNLDLFEVSVIGANSKKEVFTNLVYQMYSNKDAFMLCFNSLNQDIKNIFEHIAWRGKYYLSKEEREKMVQSVKKRYRIEEELKDEYLFFSLHTGKKWDNEDKDYLNLHIDIIKTIRLYLPKPQSYYLNPVEKPVYEYSQSSEDEILEKMRLYLNFYNMDGIQLSSSNKLLKSVKKEMKKHCSIDEYYKEGGDLEYLKTETISLFLLSIKENYLVEEYFKIQNIKTILNDFLSADLFKDEPFNFTTKFLNYLKGVKNIWNEEEHLKETMITLKQVLNDLPTDSVIEVNNILDYIDYRDCFTDIISPQNVYDYLYINEADYGRSKINSYESYHKYITVPMYKSMLTILGSLGILDLYYDMPTSKNGLYLKNGYLTKYDGIKYIRLTKLGEFALGKRDNYNFGESGEEIEVYLDEERLIVTIIGDGPMKSMFLEQVGYKIGFNKFKLDYQSLLRNVNNIDDLNKRIKDFKNKISNNLPPIWQDFFAELEKKVNSVTPAKDMKIFKLKEDKELINIVAKDEILRKHIFKAEGFYILVQEEHVKTVLKRLENFGYFNNNEEEN